MDITRALYKAVHDFPAGTDALAAALKMNRSSLWHKVNPHYLTAHCSPEEMALICEVTGDSGALFAIADRLGFICVPMRQLEDQATHDRLVSTVHEFSEFLTASSAGFADGQISDNELDKIEREALDAIQAINDLAAKARAINQAGKPAELRTPQGVRSLRSDRAQAST